MTSRFSPSRRLAVLSHSNFRLLFFATLGSGLGTWMATIALVVDVNDRTNSSWWVGALFIVTFLPSVVVGLVAGPLIDRLSRKRLLVSSDLVRLAVFVALPFVDTALAIVLLAAVNGIANSFFRPAVLAGVPNLVPAEELASGTSLLQATDWVATAVGPVLGGALVSASGPHIVYWINAATFAFSAALIVRIPGRFLQSEQGITRGHWRDLGDGFTAFRRSRPLLTALVSFGIAMLAVGLVNVAEIFLVKRSLGSNAFGYGLLWTALGVGLVAGSLATGALLEQRDAMRIYPVAFAVWAAGAVGAGVSPNIWVAALAMVLSGFGNGVAFPLTVVIVQRHTVDHLRGRVFTVIISAHNALLGIAFVSAGALTNAIGPRWVYVASAGILAAAGTAAYTLGRKDSLRSIPA